MTYDGVAQPMTERTPTGQSSRATLTPHACMATNSRSADRRPKAMSSAMSSAEGMARATARDRHLEMSLRPAEALSDDERAFCIAEFFHAHRPRMIDPYPRYAELLARREQSNG